MRNSVPGLVNVASGHEVRTVMVVGMVWVRDGVEDILDAMEKAEILFWFFLVNLINLRRFSSCRCWTSPYTTSCPT